MQLRKFLGQNRVRLLYIHTILQERNAGFWFSIVCLDEAGAIAHLQGACIVGLATCMAKITGDPLQGTLSARSFAAVHALYGRASDLQFATRSLRCPNEIMKIVEPAYRDAFDEDLVISGVPTDERPLSGVVQTTFSHTSIDAIRELCGEDLLMMGFTNRAIEEITNAHTVDSAIGLEAAVAIVIFEKKEDMRSHQYQKTKLVPALTRCTNILIRMWKEGSWDTLPWTKTVDGRDIRLDGYEVLANIADKRWIENPLQFVQELRECSFGGSSFFSSGGRGAELVFPFSTHGRIGHLSHSNMF